jgi:hypothetical protein
LACKFLATFEQVEAVAKNLHAKGEKFIRGGAFKPRTSPYDFQGLGFSPLACKFLATASTCSNDSTEHGPNTNDLLPSPIMPKVKSLFVAVLLNHVHRLMTSKA